MTDTGVDDRIKPWDGLYAARDHALTAEMAVGVVRQHIGI